MTIRERLAALLIGRELSEARQDADTYRRLWEQETAKTGRQRASLRAIHNSLIGTESGTAVRVRRMC